MKKFLLIFLILLMPASANLFAEINKWVDSDNRVHYSDQPPPANAKTSTPAKSKTPSPTYDSFDSADKNEAKNDAIPSSAVAAPKTIMEREAELKKSQKAKQEAADKAAVKQANEEIMKTNCANAQQTLRSLQSGVRVAEINASGERSFLEDAQVQQRIVTAQQAVSTYCK